MYLVNNETIKQYTDNSTQKTETITIDSTTNARLSFVATGDNAAIDNVTITGTRGQEEETISITRPTATITGSTVTLTTTVTNTGNVATTTKTLKFYRHRSPTDNPTTGGTAFSSLIIQAISPNESTTEIITTTTPTVTETTRYYYYACIDTTCSEPATIQVQPAVQEPETTEDITITNITATPISPESGTPVTLQFTVQNNGATSLNPKTVLIYQHRSPTNNPTTGARIAQTATTGTLNPNESTTKTITTIAPAVTTATRYYYYACIDAICSESATIYVQLATQEPEQEPEIVAVPEPPYERCWSAPVRRTPMGGDKMIRQIGRLGITDCTTITLGGIETTDGTRGFVMSGHGADGYKTPFQTPDSTYFSHDWDDRIYKIKGVFGKAFKMPYIRTEGIGKVVVADAAFIAYPRSNTLGCSVTWRYDNETYCFDTGHGEYTEGVAPLTIRGRGNSVYKVVGSQRPVKGLEVNLTGSRTGVHEGFRVRVTATKFLVEAYSGYYLYAGTASNATGLPETLGGDSGSPVYTVPDENGAVWIVGIHHGIISLGKGDENMTELVFSLWDDVIDALNLKPISP